MLLSKAKLPKKTGGISKKPDRGFSTEEVGGGFIGFSLVRNPAGFVYLGL
jgi:hypothetical protein